MQPFTMGVDWLEIGQLMEESIMFNTTFHHGSGLTRNGCLLEVFNTAILLCPAECTMLPWWVLSPHLVVTNSLCFIFPR